MPSARAASRGFNNSSERMRTSRNTFICALQCYVNTDYDGLGFEPDYCKGWGREGYFEVEINKWIILCLLGALGMGSSREERLELGKKRLRRILEAHVVATARTLEQKISDAGPFHQRIDPHVLTTARNELVKEGVIETVPGRSVRWYHLKSVREDELGERMAVLEPVYESTNDRLFTLRTGQALEIAVYKALRGQREYEFLGGFPDLDQHDDSTLYAKEEPPSGISGDRIRGNRKLDFVILGAAGERAGVEAKNIREWLYPQREEIRELIGKCVDLNAVPVLIGRRMPYVTFSVLSACGVVLHQTYNQLYANADRALAERVREKRLLGYHDIRVGNDPDERLLKFVPVNLA